MLKMGEFCTFLSPINRIIIITIMMGSTRIIGNAFLIPTNHINSSMDVRVFLSSVSNSEKELPPPREIKISPSLLAYKEKVKQEWVKSQGIILSDENGVPCTGEPAMDPSRIIASDEDSEWLQDYIIEHDDD